MVANGHCCVSVYVIVTSLALASLTPVSIDVVLVITRFNIERLADEVIVNIETETRVRCAIVTCVASVAVIKFVFSQ